MGIFWWGSPEQFVWWWHSTLFNRIPFLCYVFGARGGTNNFAELMSLKMLLMFTLEKGCTELNFLGDSLNVINWINQTQECRHLRLAHIIYSIWQLLLRFDSFSCRHVYRENNKEADKASKEGLRLAASTWMVKETNDGRTQEFYHRSFIELLWYLTYSLELYVTAVIFCRIILCLKTLCSKKL